ncbi:MAG TPA: chromate efflux transporter [Thermoanaerobaculia bacterium]|nr:chromate efflux transporter [Thermoanaerobaculia bacterium]
MDAAVKEVARVALRLGITAFGGPAVHIAMLREEVVTRRKWMSDEEFVDLLGATNLIPGPNSTEMVLHCGFVRGGWRGFLAGGLFIVPAALIVGACAWAYVTFGKTPAAEWILYGIKPVIIAVVLEAIWGLVKTTSKTPLAVVATIAAFALYLLGINELAILFGAGLLFIALRTTMNVTLLAVSPELLRLFFSFLKIGAVLYGSGYVLLAFVRTEFVERLGWLTDRQILDAVAVGQFTPGPLFTTATFIGYLIGSWPGAVLATIGIFLPSFVFVAITNPLVPRIRRSRIASALLDGVNAAAIGLMAGVTWQLGRSAIVDWFTAILAVLSAIVLVRWRINSAWLVLAGALIAVIARLF